MATSEQCEQALHQLADQLGANAARRGTKLDRSLSCTLPDLALIFAGTFKDGQLVDIARTDTPAAQIRLRLSSDDLLALVNGQLKVASAWATGRLKIEAGVMDLIRLKSMF